jgi:hypothetical protein
MTCRSAFLLCSVLALVAPGLPGCAAWRATTGPKLPQANSTVLDQLVVFSDSTLPQRHRLLEELNSQRGLVRSKLNLAASDERIYVYLFANADGLKDFMRARHPDFPDRRAFFVETDTRLEVYAYWGDRVAEDMRHEVAHGYLHSMVPHLPLWLDEGLAEYFEVPRGDRGLNQRHVHELTAAQSTGWQPNLRRLEDLRSAGQMTQLDYAEAWLWVHFMLETSPDRLELLRGHLQSLRGEDPPEQISQRLRTLHLDYERKLIDHLAALSSSLR